MAPTTVTFGYDGKLDHFTVLTTGVYTIDAFGAQGGSAKAPGGNGGETKADFYLTAGTVLDIVVGQQGGDGFNTRGGFASGGGGGGTFVASLNDGQIGDAILVSAGGGGGGKGNSGASSAIGNEGGGGLGGGGSNSGDISGLLPFGLGGFGGGSGSGGSLGIGTDGTSIFLTRGSGVFSSFALHDFRTKFVGGSGGDGGTYDGLKGGFGGTGLADYYTAKNAVYSNAVKTGNGSVSITYTPVLPTPTSVVDFKKDPAKYMGAIRDYDGNNLGGASSWKLLGDADIKGDGGLESILVNPEIGRFASVGVASGTIDFSKYGLNGDTRVVGIYIDPTLKNKPENIGGPLDSQRRFQNDLKKDNLKLLAAGDYNKDGFQDLYFKLGDGSAVLRAVMFKDGNIQYANYQSKTDLTTFMTNNNVSSSVWGGWI